MKKRKTKGSVTEEDIVIGKNLRKFRTLNGISQDTLASAIGITFQQVQKYERGNNRISASKLLHISIFLEVDIKSFYGGLLDNKKSNIDGLDMETIKIAKKIKDIKNKDILAMIKMLTKLAAQ